MSRSEATGSVSRTTTICPSRARRASQLCSGHSWPSPTASRPTARARPRRSPTTRLRKGRPRTGGSRSSFHEPTPARCRRRHAPDDEEQAMMGISSRDILRIVLAGIGLTSVCALVYLAGPLISIGGWRPLESYIAREITILVLVAVFASVMAVNWTRRKKATAKIAEGIATPDKVEDDADVLKDRMKDALATLKTASGGKSDFLYDLPWYVLIGPPGSGKTTALVNSGLKFPLSRGATPAAIAGVGGTRYCDWWFTEEAVMIDTAGRYTTQDSDAAADKASWFSFLDLLKKSRPRQPINGVLVAISIEDILTMSRQDLAAHAEAIRMRLLELHQRLNVSFPVYALITKVDLVAGFAEYFVHLSDQGRRQVWGATFQTADKSRNMVGEIPVEYDALLERLSEETIDRLQDEPAPNTRVLL